MPDNRGARRFAESILGDRPKDTEAGQEPTPEGGEPPSPLARRGTGQNLMLEFRFKTGDSDALSYAYLVRARCHGNTRIEMQFSVCDVTIEGSNLRQLYNQIKTHRRSFVEEETDSALRARAAETTTPQHVSRITIHDPEEDDDESGRTGKARRRQAQASH